MAANIKDVAKQAGVSPSTVSRVIANSTRISEGTRQRVRTVMKELNYHPNAIARSLVKQSAQAIGLLIPSTIDQFFSNPFFPEVLRGITQVAQNAGYDLFLSTALHGLNDIERLEHMVRGKQVDGVILLTARISDPLLVVLTENHIPAVLIGRPAVPTTISWVNNDNRQAAYDATNHLLRLGHKRIGFIGGASDLVVTMDRLSGYASALEDAGISFDPRLVISEDFLEEGGYTGMMRLLAIPERPGAVIASDDVLAFGAMRAAGELGYLIPDDLAIVGFNDIPLAKLSNPPLTTMNVHIFELGQQSAQMLLAQMKQPDADPRQHLVSHDLVIRRSCGAWNPLTPKSYQGDPL